MRRGRRGAYVAALVGVVVGSGLLVAGGLASRAIGAVHPSATSPEGVTAPVSDAGLGQDEPVSWQGDGTFRPASGSAKRAGSGKVLRYRVEVENGLDDDPGEFARSVDRILADRRGWTARGQWAFQRPAAGPFDFVVKLAAPATVDEICARYGLATEGEASCRGGTNVVINVKRWRLAIPAYNGDVEMYRHLVVNHEVGHFLGLGHAGCPGEGEPAPVMQTQMYGMDGCVPNGWPYPDG